MKRFKRLIFGTDDSISLLFLRLALGIVIFPHGAQKAFGWFGGSGLLKTIEIFSEKMHLPPLLTLLLIFIEVFGSIGLVFGFFTRFSALGIGISMAICAYMNHVQNGFFMNWFGQQKGEGFEFHILVVGIAISLFLKGGGILSIDRKAT